MKKLLLSSMMLAAGLFAANAAEANFDFVQLYGPENTTDLAPATDGAVTVSFDSEGATTPAQYYKNGTSLRLYANNKMTLSVPSGSTITGVEYTLRDGTYNHGDDDSFYTVDNGTFHADFEACTATWAGNAEAFTLTVSAEKNAAGKNVQLHIRSIKVTYDEGEVTKCSNPKFTPAEGTYYGSVNVTLDCNTDGVTLMYSVNGEAEQVYGEGILLDQVGTYEIEAYAKKSGIDDSDKVKATYEVKAPVAVSSLEELIMVGETEPEGTLFQLDFPITVTYQMPNYTYVKDDEGGVMLIYGKEVPAYNQGDVIPAGVQGKFTVYNGLYEMQYPVAESFKPATETKAADPVVMKVGEIAVEDINKVVLIRNANYADKVLTDETGSINVFYQKAWEEVQTQENGEYDVIAAVAVYKETLQVYPIKFMEAGASVEETVAGATVINAVEGGVAVNAAEACEVSVFTAAGQLVENVNVAAGAATIDLAAGFYVVKAGNEVAKVIVK